MICLIPHLWISPFLLLLPHKGMAVDLPGVIRTTLDYVPHARGLRMIMID